MPCCAQLRHGCEAHHRRSIVLYSSVVRILVEQKHFTPPTTSSSVMHSHQMDSRDPYSRLIAQKQQATQQQIPMSGGYVQGYGPPQLSPLTINQPTGFNQPHAHPSPTGQMSTLSMSQFILPTNENSVLPSSSASVATASASSSTITTLVAPPVNTTYSKLPWDRTGLPHATSLTAEAAISRERFVARFQQQKVQKKMDDIKLKHRSSLKLPDWQRYGYYNTFASLRAAAFADMPRQTTSHLLADGRASSPYTAARATEKPDLRYSLEKIHWKELPLEEFRKQYEIPKIPVIITGLTDTWAMKNWTFNDVGGEHSHFRNVPMKCGQFSKKARDQLMANYNLADELGLHCMFADYVLCGLFPFLLFQVKTTTVTAPRSRRSTSLSTPSRIRMIRRCTSLIPRSMRMEQGRAC